MSTFGSGYGSLKISWESVMEAPLGKMERTSQAGSETPGGSGQKSKEYGFYYTQDHLDKCTASRKFGMNREMEFKLRRHAAHYILTLGQWLKVSQRCINTAIVYMNRFYMFYSFTHFDWRQIGAAAMFLAAKFENQFRLKEHLIVSCGKCDNENVDMKSSKSQKAAEELLSNENLLIQSLGFENLAVEHPHSYVMRWYSQVSSKSESKDLIKKSYLLANISLHLTTLCLQYKPTVVACFCIYLASKLYNLEIPLSVERKSYIQYLHKNLEIEVLNKLTEEYRTIFENYPKELANKLNHIGGDPGNYIPVGPLVKPEFTKQQHQKRQEAAKRRLEEKQQMLSPSDLDISDNSDLKTSSDASQVEFQSPSAAASVPEIQQPPLVNEQNCNSYPPITTSTNAAAPSASGGNLPDLQPTHHSQQPPLPPVPRVRPIFDPRASSQPLSKDQLKFSLPAKTPEPKLKRNPLQPLVSGGSNNPAVISHLLREVPDGCRKLSLAGPSETKPSEKKHDNREMKNKQKPQDKANNKILEEKEKYKPIPKIKLRRDSEGRWYIVPISPPESSHEIKTSKIKGSQQRSESRKRYRSEERGANEPKHYY